MEKGVTMVECDKEAFRKRVLPQTDNFIKARPEAKPVVDMIRATAGLRCSHGVRRRAAARGGHRPSWLSLLRP